MLFPFCKTLFRAKETEIEHLSLVLVLQRKYRFSDMTNSAQYVIAIYMLFKQNIT